MRLLEGFGCFARTHSWRPANRASQWVLCIHSDRVTLDPGLHASFWQYVYATVPAEKHTCVSLVWFMEQKKDRLRFTLLSMLLESPILLSPDAFTACQSIASNYGYNALNWLNGRGARLQLRKLLKGCAVACREPSPESCVQVCIGGETGLNRGRCQELIALGCTAGLCVYSNLTLS